MKGKYFILTVFSNYIISEESENFESMGSMMEIPRESEAETEYIVEKSEVVEIEMPDKQIEAKENVNLEKPQQKNIGKLES